jgi:predicted DsbA family dithiol-disulfide isomerase
MHIDVWSDVACPWCYLGKRNLEAALATTGIEAEISWRAFELDPGAPATIHGSIEEMLATKYGLGIDEARRMNAEMTERARQAGLEFRLDQAKMGSSFDAHRLAKMAEARGLGSEATERLFAAHFTQGLQISDPETLVSLGVEIGLDAAKVASMLASDAFAEEVRDDEAQAGSAGFTGVPTFVINQSYVISGAQSVETMAKLLGQQTETT